MKFLILFYALGGGLVGTAVVLSQDVDLFPDCRGSEYARPTCGDNAGNSGQGYRSGDFYGRR